MRKPTDNMSFQFPLWDTSAFLQLYIFHQIFQFPLWDTLIFSFHFYLFFTHFQFPLWDTQLKRLWLRKNKFLSIPFMGYPPPASFTGDNVNVLSIPFMGYIKCLYFCILIKIFQFPLWDTKKIHSSDIKLLNGFNSLYGIHLINLLTWINLHKLSIPFMGYGYSS